MSTSYVLKKCKRFGFANSLEEIRKNVDEPILLESFEENEGTLDKNTHHNFVVNLQSD